MTYGLRWIDTKARAWDVVRGPVRLTDAGLKGLGLPDVDEQVQTAAGQDGQTLIGWTLKPRTVFLPIRFRGAAALDTTGLQRQFWDGVTIGQFGTFEVTDSDGAVRTLTMRIADDGGIAYRYHPDVLQPDAIGLTFTADDPFWYGPDTRFDYNVGGGNAVNFFGGGDPYQPGYAPTFFIMPSYGASNPQAFPNPGKYDMWPTWTIPGPATSFDIAVNGHHIAGAVNVGAGRQCVITTDPRQQTIQVGPIPAAGQAFAADTVVPYYQMTALDFAAIPAGGTANVQATIQGGSTGLASIHAVGRTRYDRAF